MSREKELIDLVTKQLENNFSILSSQEKEVLESVLPEALRRSKVCFKNINNKYYNEFNFYHSGQYSIFLYFLSNEASKLKEKNELSNKIYYLNKIMNSLDLYSEVELPRIFYFEHPVGTVLGRAKYSDYFTIFQNCTVGGNRNKKGEIKYPEFSKNVTLYSYACVIGDCQIGSNVIISSHCYIKDENIPSNSIVFGQSPNLIIKENKKKNFIFKEE